MIFPQALPWIDGGVWFHNSSRPSICIQTLVHMEPLDTVYLDLNHFLNDFDKYITKGNIFQTKDRFEILWDVASKLSSMLDRDELSSIDISSDSWQNIKAKCKLALRSVECLKKMLDAVTKNEMLRMIEFQIIVTMNLFENNASSGIMFLESLTDSKRTAGVDTKQKVIDEINNFADLAQTIIDEFVASKKDFRQWLWAVLTLGKDFGDYSKMEDYIQEVLQRNGISVSLPRPPTDDADDMEHMEKCDSKESRSGSVDGPADPEDCDSEVKSVEGDDGKISVQSSIQPPASSPKKVNGKGKGSVDGPADPEDCDSEVKSVEGDDGKISVQSSIQPPASSPKKVNGKGKAPPKKKNRSKQRNSNQRKNAKKARSKSSGSRIILNPSPPVPNGVTNKRRCTLDALLALIENDTIKDAVATKFLSTMSPSGDTPMDIAMKAVADHRMSLIPVTRHFMMGCRAYNLLQWRYPCRFVIVIKLLDLKHPNWFSHHTVAWDGSIVYDRPKSVRVNDTKDRATSASCKAVFERLFHKNHYHRWQIENIYKLVNVVGTG